MWTGDYWLIPCGNWRRSVEEGTQGAETARRTNETWSYPEHSFWEGSASVPGRGLMLRCWLPWGANWRAAKHPKDKEKIAANGDEWRKQTGCWAGDQSYNFRCSGSSFLYFSYQMFYNQMLWTREAIYSPSSLSTWHFPMVNWMDTFSFLFFLTS